MIKDKVLMAIEVKPVHNAYGEPGWRKEDRVEWHALNWARYMRTGTASGLGMPRSASGGIGVSHSADFDQLADAADVVAAKAVDAIISHDLKPLEAKAMKCEYLGEKWLRDDMDMGLVLVIAKEGLMRGLNRKGIV
jgi:hypothetical protein